MRTELSVKQICLLVFAVLLISVLADGAAWDYGVEPYSKWPLAKAVAILNSGPWARQETFTRVVPGVGSGVSGEKEIYNTFYVRFLSARPIREAYARVQQLQHGYENLTEEQKSRFDKVLQPGLDMNVDRWLVVAVSFRSNDPAEESTVRRFLQSQTTETLKTLAFLSTSDNPQIELAAYYPPREESVGAKFVFPRSLDGSPIVDPNTKQITFELLDVPGANPSLRATFFTEGMVFDGKVIL